MKQAKLLRVKALKMFKASIDGALPIMINPGDVVDVDMFTGSMLVKSEKAELTEEKLFINKEYKAPARVNQASDGLGAQLLQAINTLSASVGHLSTAKAAR